MFVSLVRWGSRHNKHSSLCPHSDFSCRMYFGQTWQVLVRRRHTASSVSSLHNIDPLHLWNTGCQCQSASASKVSSAIYADRSQSQLVSAVTVPSDLPCHATLSLTLADHPDPHADADKQLLTNVVPSTVCQQLVVYKMASADPHD